MDLNENPDFLRTEEGYVPTPQAARAAALTGFQRCQVLRPQEADLQDVAQDVTLRAARVDWAALGDCVQPMTYLVGIARNCVRAWLRSRRRVPAQLESTDFPDTRLPEFDHHGATRRQVLLAEFVAATRLQGRELDAFLLGRESGYGENPALARRLGMSVVAFQTALSRARAKVRADGRVSPEEADRQLRVHFRRALAAGTLGPLARQLAEDVCAPLEEAAEVAVAELYCDAATAILAGQRESSTLPGLVQQLGRCVTRWGGISPRPSDWADEDFPLPAPGRPVTTAWFFLEGVTSVLEFLADPSRYSYPDNHLLPLVGEAAFYDRPGAFEPALNQFLRAVRLAARLGDPRTAARLLDRAPGFIDDATRVHGRHPDQPRVMVERDAALRLIADERRNTRAIV